MKKTSKKPKLIHGGLSSDERGAVGYINEFNFEKVKRFYFVINKKINYFRGWHGHKKEEKYVFVVKGKAKIGAVEVDNWKNPSKDLKVHSFTLSSEDPKILHIPAGYANGFTSLVKDTKVIFFSTSTLIQSKNDDIRFDEDYWKV